MLEAGSRRVGHEDSMTEAKDPAAPLPSEA